MDEVCCDVLDEMANKFAGAWFPRIAL
jgi:hypothetical protein